jgi:two-component system LytT family response regulator
MSGRPLRTVVVEDERLARAELCGMLAGFPGITVVGQAAGLDEARRVIAAAKPDVVFLDIRLGRANGFTLVEDGTVDCDVVFVTAYDEHAVRAFEVSAVDYLLKPVDPERLAEAVRRLTGGARAVAAPEGRLHPDDRMLVKSGTRWRFLTVRAIRCIRSAGDYSLVLTTDGAETLVSRSLREWEARLPEHGFARVHRGAIVNLEEVVRVDEDGPAAFSVWIRGLAEPVPMSRRRAAGLRGPA